MTPLTAPKLIRVGHSPDPDDAFMFYALAKNLIPMRGFQVEHVIEDIENLNQRALGTNVGAKPASPLEVTAVSCHAYAFMADQYVVMRAGSSIGDNYGPILAASSSARHHNGAWHSSKCPDIRGKKIGIPGKLTTAYLALQLFDAHINGRGEACLAPTFLPVFIPFDKIFDAVESGQVDLGLIIHEGQITFQKKGFEKVLDLGQWWHELYQLPLPLGVDVIRRDLGAETIREFSALFKESIQYALSHRTPALEYAKQYGRGIADDLNDRFVGMYVNDLTVDLGPQGEAGFRKLLELGHKHGLLPKPINLEFV